MVKDQGYPTIHYIYRSVAFQSSQGSRDLLNPKSLIYQIRTLWLSESRWLDQVSGRSDYIPGLWAVQLSTHIFSPVWSLWCPLENLQHDTRELIFSMNPHCLECQLLKPSDKVLLSESIKIFPLLYGFSAVVCIIWYGIIYFN